MVHVVFRGQPRGFRVTRLIPGHGRRYRARQASKVLQPLLTPFQLPLVHITLLEKVACIVVELDVQLIKLLNALDGGVVQVDAGRTRAVVLHKRSDELEMEGALEKVLRFALKLGQTKEGHVTQVFLGRLQQDLSTLLLGDERHIVASHKAEVSQHAHLPVVGQVVGALHKLLQGTA